MSTGARTPNANSTGTTSGRALAPAHVQGSMPTVSNTPKSLSGVTPLPGDTVQDMMDIIGSLAGGFRSGDFAEPPSLSRSRYRSR